MKGPGAEETLLRYSLLQIPGLVIIGFIAWLLLDNEVISGTAAAAVWLGWLLKDIVMYPFVKHAYASGNRAMREKLIGEKGVVVRSLAPRGFVRVRGELWQAETASGNETLCEGSRIKVHAAGGMCLQVVGLPEDEDG